MTSTFFSVDDLKQGFGLRYGVPCLKFLFYLQPYLFYLIFKYHSMEIIILKLSRLFLFISRLFQKVSLKIQSFLIIFRVPKRWIKIFIYFEMKSSQLKYTENL